MRAGRPLSTHRRGTVIRPAPFARALIGSLLLVFGASHAVSQTQPEPAPDFVLKSLSGENLRLSEFRGEVVMLSFWASWCGDCRRDLAGLGRIQALYHDAGLELLAVSMDPSRAQAENAAASFAASFPVLHDLAGEVGRLYAVDAVPTTVLIDRNGVVREVFSGYRPSDTPPYLEPLRALLRE